MTFMKKHPLISFDFYCSVQLPAKEKKAILGWLDLAVKVMAKLMANDDFIHPRWNDLNKPYRVSITLCGESRIKKLNFEYRSKDKVTDVLSFPGFESLRKAPQKNDPVGPEVFLGDLVICHQKTQKQARDFEISYHDEFIHLFMHGFIHLLGYDHEKSKKEEKMMQAWEELSLEHFSKAKKKGA